MATTSLGLVACLAVGCGVAYAQPITTGSVRGRVVVTSTHEPAVGATIVATSPALQGFQTALADDTGGYFITALPPGLYVVTVYYAGAALRRDVLVQLGKQAFVNFALDVAGGEVVEVKGTAPLVDQGSTKTGVTLTEDYTRNIPTEHRLSGVLSAPAGAQVDLFGTSLSGGTSPENSYIVDGVVVNDPGLATLSTDVPNEFIAETEIITGGYNAEYGRAMGGIANVITKQGGNTFHGSLFYYLKPAALAAPARAIDVEGGSISTRSDLDMAYDLGGEVGGPIVKDKLWFHVGFDPHVTREATTRTVGRQIDADQDGVPDRDPDTGFTEHQRLVSTRSPAHDATYYFTAKLTGAVDENHRFQLALFGDPATGANVLGGGRAPGSMAIGYARGSYNATAKWTSKLAGGATELAAQASYHRTYNLPRVSHEPAVSYNYERSLYDFADLEVAGIDACNDRDPDDPYPLIRNCPVTGYLEQGHGIYGWRRDDRITAAASLTHRASLAGYHVVKAGLDLEYLRDRTTLAYAGGFSLVRSANAPNGAPGRWRLGQLADHVRNLTREEQLNPAGVALGPDEMLCQNDRAVCAIVDAVHIGMHQIVGGAYVRDSWLIAPNLTLDVGARWDRQIVYVADALAGTLTPEGEVIASRAFALDNVAPRVGAIFDPTREGRAKLFAHYGRFYEQLPLSVNAAIGNGIIANTQLNPNRRLPSHPQYDPSCDVDHGTPDLVSTILSCSDRSETLLFGGGNGFAARDLRGQFSEEIVGGAEYEVVPQVRLGAVYQHRSVPVVIEDISIDGGNTYFIANPGENFDAEARQWRDQAARTGDPALAAVYDRRADQLESTKRISKPSRNYDALQLTLAQRPTTRSLVLASYTYSATKGNYPGLFDRDQLLPNLTMLFDLPDMLANTYGYLGLDRTHNLKTDAFYQLGFGATAVTLGTSVRVQSGIAHTPRAGSPHLGYGGESYLMPAGSWFRSPVTAELDLHVALALRLDKQRLEGFIRLFNVLDDQAELTVDENYTFEAANPIAGGDLADLAHLKAVDELGHELGRTVTRNRNFGHVTSRQSPRSVQIGARWQF